MSKWHYYECPECGYDSVEAKRLSLRDEGDCPICAEDCGRDVALRYRPATEAEIAVYVVSLLRRQAVS